MFVCRLVSISNMYSGTSLRIAATLFCMPPTFIVLSPGLCSTTLPEVILLSGRVLRTTQPMAQCDIPENLNPQPHCHENLKSCVYGYFLFRLCSFINDCVIVISLMP